MRAWVLILAVLATFKPIIQVVSTKGNNTNFYSNSDTNIIYNKKEINNINNNYHNNVTSSPVIINNINNNNNNINENSSISYNNNQYNKNINNTNSQTKLNIISINSFHNENNKTYSTLINNKLDNHIINNNYNKISSKNNGYNILNNNNNNDKINNNNKNIENFKTTNNYKESELNNYKESKNSENNRIENEDINNNSNNIENNLENNDNGKLKPDPETLVQIETSLLSLFGLKKPPKIDRSKIVIPEAMKRLYAQIMGNEFDSVTIPKPGLHTHSANTVRSFIHESTDIDEKYQHHHKFRLFFNVNSIPTEEKLKAAELQITRDKIEFDNPNILQQRQRFRVSAYDILKIGNNNNNNHNHNNNNNDQRDTTSYLLLDTKTIYLNSSETLSLDVQSAVNRWLESPDDNNGILIEVKTARTLKPAKHNHVRLRRSLDETHEEWLPKQPLLFTYTDDGRHKTRLIRDVGQRSKRAHHSRNGHHRRKNTICQRRPLYVDFNDVGWSDWIVAPPGYDAYYCQGDCPFPLADHLNSTNHAVVQTLVNNITPAKVPKACCIPTQLSAISMLYLNDQNEVVLKNYQDMTVVGCGCR